jgi:hypothetical protein
LVVTLALGAVFSRSRRSAILFGCAWWLLGLLPVLPLLAHSYGHYLYVPMAGMAIAFAGTLEALVSGIGRLEDRVRGRLAPAAGGVPQSRVSARRRAVVAATFVALALGFAWRSETLLRMRVTARLGASELALDPFTRKMEVAQRAIYTLTGQLDRSHDSVVVFNPSGIRKPISTSTGKEVEAPAAGAHSYDVIEAVLGGGMALRIFEPRLDSVAFVHRWTPEYRNFNLFIGGPGGQMMGMGRGPQAHSRFAGAMIDAGYVEQAREYLAALVRAYPGDRLIRLLFAAALSRTGDADSARAHARLVIEGARPDTLTATARNLLATLGAAK